MAESNATILIPDISGFTEFMTSTELTHSSHALNYLIDAIVKAVGDEYEVSEIEGDAVLLIKKGPPPTKKEILDTCLKIFNAFHFQRKWMQLHTICPCGACMAIINLTLKFVVHHGPLAEIRVGNFVKQAGPEMIVAHRLLKNSIANNEYLLLTEKLLKEVVDSSEPIEMEWVNSSEEYPSIGKIDYRFALLNDARKKCPEPPEPESNYRTDNTSNLEIPIGINYFDAYMIVKEIPERAKWMPGLLKVEQEIQAAFIGSIHYCSFENYVAIVSPIRMVPSDEGIMFAERCQIKEFNISLVYEYVFRKVDDNNCSFASRFMSEGENPVPEEIKTVLFERMKTMAQRLKEVCEKTKTTSVEEFFQEN